MKFGSGLTIASTLLSFTLYSSSVQGAPRTSANTAYNLNGAAIGVTDPMKYQAVAWPTEPHVYHTSPVSWRIPFYTVILDKFSDGDPSNNQLQYAGKAGGSGRYDGFFEFDPLQTSFRAGGDVAGLASKLDYLQNLGIQAIYIAGTIFKNFLWDAHGYNPLDFTLLDEHSGTVEEWRNLINAMHARGMYLVLDLTLGTLSDVLAFQGYENVSAPFNMRQYPVHVKEGVPADAYIDFSVNNTLVSQCDFPTYFNGQGFVEGPELETCQLYDSDFAQFGDVDAFGTHPNWKRSLAKFFGVQDRLREWKPSVRDKISHMTCILIQSLDIDGFRVDKATQMSLDPFLTFWSASVRKCAAMVGKANFLVSAEITGGVDYGALFVGQGRQPQQRPTTIDQIPVTLNRDKQHSMRDTFAFDSVAFHYSIYRSMLVFLGLYGKILAPFDLTPDWVDGWNQLLVAQDYRNPNFGGLDPHDLFGIANQDTFRWQALTQGPARVRLGQFVTTFLLPGAPLIYYGEEQESMKVLDSTAENYLFGRQAMFSSLAWQLHGCFQFKGLDFYHLPLNVSEACKDNSQSRDHFDPTSTGYAFLRTLLAVRRQFTVFVDGLQLSSLSFSGSFVKSDSYNPEYYTNASYRGIWSVQRGFLPSQQQPLASAPRAWLIYSNLETSTFVDGCDSKTSIVSPFTPGTIVKNVLPPYDIFTVGSMLRGGLPVGCLGAINLSPFGFLALLPAQQISDTAPVLTLTSIFPSHDSRLVIPSTMGTLQIRLEFSSILQCTAVTSALTVTSTSGTIALPENAECGLVTSASKKPSGVVQGQWFWAATLSGLTSGMYTGQIRLPGYSASWIWRIGASDNLWVNPTVNGFSVSLIRALDGKFVLFHDAPGATKFRYSLTDGLSWTSWKPYEMATALASTTEISTSTLRAIIEYWAPGSGVVRIFSAASSSGEPLSDVNVPRLPKLHALGPFNEFGTDFYAPKSMIFRNGLWSFPLMTKFPTTVQLDVYDDLGLLYGDLDGDGVLDRVAPNSHAINRLTIPSPKNSLGWILRVNESTLAWSLEPKGSFSLGMVIYFILLLMPITSGLLAVYLFKVLFYRVHIVIDPMHESSSSSSPDVAKGLNSSLASRLFSDNPSPQPDRTTLSSLTAGSSPTVMPAAPMPRKRVLMATLEYEIPDWKLKVRIGGMGVITSLSFHVKDVDYIWVVPMISGVQYGPCTDEDPILVKVLGQSYHVRLYSHRYHNVTFLLLECGPFYGVTATEPYPARMDDLESAVFYSTWNQCIAEVMQRYPFDVYHCNDFHGALAPLYLLPRTIPVFLSLHNSEFQGLWPLRSSVEKTSVCSVFNIAPEVCSEYVQFGTTFNILHSGAKYIAKHQAGYGVIGVSEQYANHCFKRYPCLWSLQSVMPLSNPNPADRVGQQILPTMGVSNEMNEKTLLQSWANLEVFEDAIILLFVGRLSRQKGVDLIADLALVLMLEHRNLQLIVIGPVIDLYGKLTAIKLQHLSEAWPGRICIKPVFTKTPPFISACDFILIPSRDEPFGLVAVEYGRLGLIGIGSKVGGLGNMPGYWFTVESNQVSHLHHQFLSAIRSAIHGGPEQAEKQRRNAAFNRFPVENWSAKLIQYYSNVQYYQKPVPPSLDTRIRSALMPRQRTPIETLNSIHIDQHPMELPYLIRGDSGLELSNRVRMSTLSMSTEESGAEVSIDISSVEQESSGRESEVVYSAHHQVVLPFIHVLNPSDYKQQPFEQFTDADGKLVEKFTGKMTTLTPFNTTGSLCIDFFLKSAEEDYYKGKQLEEISKLPDSSKWLKFVALCSTALRYSIVPNGGWPMYSILLGLGQILSLNVLQIVLLVGSVSADMFYVMPLIYVAGTAFWWGVYSRYPSVWVLAPPFFFFSCSFLLMTLCPIWPSLVFVCLAMYIWGSAASAMLFVLNFGQETAAGAHVAVMRAGILVAIQQVWTMIMWYFWQPNGSILELVDGFNPGWVAACAVIAVLFFGIGGILMIGMPPCYFYDAPIVPDVVRNLFKRRLVVWFLVSQFVQNFLLSGQYAQNWSFLWSQPIGLPITIGLILTFGLAFWAFCLYLLYRASKIHSWILPVFAAGLLAPRWAQMLWSVSDMGASMSWAGTGSAVASLILWLVLGVFDGIQTVGLVNMLMQTLTRIHLVVVMNVAQVLGAVAYMSVKATRVDQWEFVNPITAFDESSPPSLPPIFWIALACQVVMSLGHYVWYRQETLR